MNAAEQWRPTVGFLGYEVSDRGGVRSLDRTELYDRTCHYSGKVLRVLRRHRGRMLRPATSESGHLTVALGRGNSVQVHALVLTAFVGPRPSGMEGLHGDGKPAHNHLGNLRWGTRSENLLDAVAHGARPVGERHHHAKLRAADIPAIRSSFGSVSCAELGRRYGVSEATIRQIRDNRSWKSVRSEDSHVV